MITKAGSCEDESNQGIGQGSSTGRVSLDPDCPSFGRFLGLVVGEDGVSIEKNDGRCAVAKEEEAWLSAKS